MECPHISKDIVPDKFNKPIHYKDLSGTVDYVYYEHNDGFGLISRVQFCNRMGRKKDVFECLNENEWKNCYAYKEV